MIQFIATFIVLTLLGIVNTIYLFWKARQHKPMVCPMNHDCSIVTESKWSKIFFVKNDTLGLLFYLSMLVLILITIFNPNIKDSLYPLMLIGISGGVLFSAFLMFIQWKVIKDYCFYCIISAIINLLLFINMLALFLGA